MRRSDVKSSNVLLTRDGAAKLADLGLAAVVNERFDFQDISIGHFAYMAPELVLGMECTTKVGVHPGGGIFGSAVMQERARLLPSQRCRTRHAHPCPSVSVHEGQPVAVGGASRVDRCG